MLPLVEDYQNDEISSHPKVRFTDPLGERRWLRLLEDQCEFEIDADEKKCSDCQFDVELVDVELWGEIIKETYTKHDADGNRLTTNMRHCAWLWTIQCPCCEKKAKGAEVNRKNLRSGIDEEDVHERYVNDLMTEEAMESSLEVVLCD